MSEYISRQAVLDELEKWDWQDVYLPIHFKQILGDVPPADVRPNIHGHWERMSDLPEDKDDRYKCSRCGNVVHHSNGVNLYTFNSWCGKCGSLNNSLIAGLEPKGEKGT